MATLSNPDWLEPTPLEIPPEFQTAIGGHPLLAETLLRRGLNNLSTARAFLYPDQYIPAKAEELPGLEKTAARLLQAIQLGERIGVWGDFDVDGQTATSILVETLRSLGADVIYHIPVRARESHGINLPQLTNLRQAGAKLVLTCDTGIAAFEAAEFSQAQGFDLLITDHHSLPSDGSLPAAYSLVNPHFLPEEHPLSSLCGAGVAYQLAEFLNRQRGQSENTPALLDLAALGTVADVARLTGDNRWIVQKGLEKLRDNPRPALHAMLKLAEINPAQLNEQHLGFILGPRLNALGRLGDANPAVPFLCETAPEKVLEMASKLETLNRERQLLVKQVFEGAQAQLKRDPKLLDDPILLLSAPDWPAGVIGIVASRLVELYRRPTLLVTTPPGELARGSARSVEGIDITIALAEQAELLHGFGGHSMAAGFSLPAENIPKLRRGLGKNVSGHPTSASNMLEISAVLPLSSLTLELVEALDRLAPFGPGNPPLLLASYALTIRDVSKLGKTNEHLQLLVEDTHSTQRRVTWWQGADSPQPAGIFDLAYTVRASSYRGQRELQIEWRAFRPRHDFPPIQLSTSSHRNKPAVTRFEIQDQRSLSANQAEETLAQLFEAEKGKIIVWAEGEFHPTSPSLNRLHLTPSPVLAIWNIPPGPTELAAALETVRPRVVYLFSQPGGDTKPSTFLARLSGLVHFAVQNHGGQTSLAELAAACAHKESSVRLGLEWLAIQGHIQVVFKDGSSISLEFLKNPNANSPEHKAATEKSLKRILQEISAYQRFYATSPTDGLF